MKITKYFEYKKIILYFHHLNYIILYNIILKLN